MTRARELANFADDTAGLETLTVSDVTDLSVSASNINSATNQITDSSTDLNVDSNTLVVDKSTDRVGITNASPGEALHIKTTADADYGIKVENNDTQAFCKVQSSGNALYGGNAGVNIISGGSFATAMHIDSTGKVGIGTTPSSILHVDEGSGTSGFLFDSGLRRLKVVGSNSGSGYVSLEATDQDGSNATSRHLILEPSGGKVGIGTTAPAEKLHIQGTGNSQLTIRGDEGEDAGISLVADEGDDNADWWKTYIDHSDSSKLKIANYSIGSWSDKFIIDSSGKVGIGTSSPTEILHLADHGGSTAPAIEFTNSANSRGLEIRSTFSGDYASFLTTGGSTAGFEFGLSNGTSYLRLDHFGRLLRGDASAFSSLPSISTSGFTSVSSLYVDAVFVSSTSYYVRVFFTFTNTSGSSKSFKVTYGRNINGVNFSHRILNTLEYNSQSLRHYEGFVATATATGTIFSSNSQELTNFQQSSGTWATSGGTGAITWTESSSFGNGVEGGVVYELLLARAASSRVTSITFEAV